MATSSRFICISLKTPIYKASHHTSHYCFSYRLVSSRTSTISLQVEASTSTNEPFSSQTVSRSVDFDFHPSVWGDHFIAISSDDLRPDARSEERLNKLKKGVKEMLKAALNEPMKQLNLIDKIQRLGVSYHFETDIEDAFQRINDAPSFDHNVDKNSNLYDVALRFRLLRQAGYHISPDIFNKFKDKEGEFDKKLCMDLAGMLELYEAAHLNFPGEDVLDMAIAFTTHHLKKFMLNHDNHLGFPLLKQVQHALELPLHKRFPRLQAKHYISMYQEDESPIQPLLEFAKLDFMIVQSLHQREIGEISRWWKDMDIVSQLTFRPRDRLVEGYAMIMAIFFEPQYSKGRIYMAKLFAMLTVIDDTYDTYGTLEELQPLTNAILRWDIRAMDNLPKSMEVIFGELLSLCNEFRERVRRGQSHIFSYLIQEACLKPIISVLYRNICLLKALKYSTDQKLCRKLSRGCKIVYNREVPSLEVWFKVALVTSGVSLLVIGAMMDMDGEPVKMADLDWVSNEPKMISACAIIVRLIDDIRSFKSEQERGNSASSVACYMKDHGVSEPEAIQELRNIIKENWKEMNRECLRPTPVSSRILAYILNVARLMEVFYLYGDGYTDTRGHTKQIIASLFVDPITISGD